MQHFVCECAALWFYAAAVTPSLTVSRHLIGWCELAGLAGFTLLCRSSFWFFFIFLLHHRHRRFIALLKVLWYNSAASLFTVRCHRLPILCINYRCGAACVIACICARARSTSLHDGWGSTMSWSTLPMRFHHGADDNKEEDAKCECTLYAF